MRTNYCNCLFNAYRYADCVLELRRLVVTLEGQLYNRLASRNNESPKEKMADDALKHKVHQLSCNYYLLGKHLY